MPLLILAGDTRYGTVCLYVHENVKTECYG